jgi:hypothetical protein
VVTKATRKPVKTAPQSKAAKKAANQTAVRVTNGHLATATKAPTQTAARKALRAAMASAKWDWQVTQVLRKHEALGITV